MDLESSIDKLVMPLLKTNNYSGTILVSKNHEIVFNKAYGKMNREYDLDNELETKFFLASISMVFTSAAIMKLHETGKLSINDKLSKYYPDYKNGHLITLHDMLAQRSGIPAIGSEGNVDYNKITKFTHSTDELIEYFKEYDLLFKPDEKYNHGRSEYILLANIIEKVSGKSFGDFLNEEVFTPLEMNNTGHYKSEKMIIKNLAKGYAPKGLYDVESAYDIDWSSKTGHASIFSTANDLHKFGQAILNSELLNQESWDVITTNHGDEVGYGWFIRPHLNRVRYQMNGRSPGFSSYFAIYPDGNLIIAVLSNNYISLPADIGMNVAAIVFDEPYEPLNLTNRKLDAYLADKLIGRYKFDENFYVPNYELEIEYNDGYLTSQWGDLIPVDNGQENTKDFILRTYWSTLHFTTNDTGQVIELKYDSHSGTKID
ncbi:MAG: serine hydrolase domain-containing protein [Flagellimonas sp.]